MFEVLLPDEFSDADDATVVAAIEEYARAEAAVGARRLQAIAELAYRRVVQDDEERVHWACDFWDAAAAEVGAAMGIGHRAASREMQIGLALRDRLPKVAALYREGRLSSRLVSAITWRTHLVDDDKALRLIDNALAERATAWGPLSAYKLEQAIDVWIDRYDPAALRHTRNSARGRNVSIGSPDDIAGTAAVWGRLFATDAALLKRRLTQMTLEVCDDDPRTLGQRRADALGALAAGDDQLSCQCGKPECPSDAADGRASSVVIHVIADEAALQAKPDRYMSGESEMAEVPEPDPPNPAPATPASALIVGGGVVPTPLLAELIRFGAKVRPIRHPGTEPEPGYRPSVRHAEFVRMRDVTCRFPGCDRPAEFCDIDHTIPFPAGPTHPSNNKCVCRLHHLLKTFWTGWTDQQLADGTVIWTAPTGRTYTTHPSSRIFFPSWDTDTADLPPATAKPPTGDRGVMMPRRRRTRAADRAQRKKAERALNDAYVAQRNKPPPTRGRTA
jgi:hypothetical protein